MSDAEISEDYTCNLLPFLHADLWSPSGVSYPDDFLVFPVEHIGFTSTRALQI